MRKNFGAKTWLYPMPVLIVGTYDENGNPNAMNAAWGGVYDTNQVMVCLAHDHKTTENIKKTGAFTLSFATSNTVVPCDYVGIVSANDVPDKFTKAGFHATKSEYVNAPIIDELPMTVECKLIKFNEDGICIGEIVNVSADDSILDENGKIDAKKLDPIIYDGVTHAYWGFGEKVGQAFSDGLKIKSKKDFNSIEGLFTDKIEKDKEHYELQSQTISSDTLSDNDKILRLALLRYYSPHSDWDIAAEILRNHHTDLHGRDLLIAAHMAVNANYLYGYEHIGYFFSLLEEEELHADDSFRSVALWLRAKHLNPDPKNRDTVIELLERSIELCPDYGMHYWLLADYKTFDEKKALVDKAWGNIKKIVSFDEMRSETLSQKIDPDHILAEMTLAEVAESYKDSFQNKKRRIHIYEQYEYFKDAFNKHCGTFLLDASDEDIEYHIFKEFDALCNAFMDNKTLNRFIEHQLITEKIYDKVYDLRCVFRRLERTEFWCVSEVRKYFCWIEILKSADEIKKEINS